FEGQFLKEEFSEPFQQMWERLSEAECEALLGFANGVRVRIGEFPRLERDGYLIQRGARLAIFSRLFAEFVKEKESTLSAVRRRLTLTGPSRVFRLHQEQSPVIYTRPRAIVTPRLAVCPTALYLAAPEYAETVHFSIENPTDEMVKAQLVCQIVNYSN